MKIIELVAENYKRLKVVEITPKDRMMIPITGKNGQGKTSVLDAIWVALVGAKGIAGKPVRAGAHKARIRLSLGERTVELIVTRTINPEGTQTLTVETAKGVRMASPQKMLDDLLGELSFDPLAFISMKPKEQVETLRRVAKVELDIEALNAENAADYDERTLINRDVKRLEGEVATITVQDGLPKEKLDEAAILEKLNRSNKSNQAAQAQFKAKQELGAQAHVAKNAAEDHRNFIDDQRGKVKNLEALLKAAEDAVATAEMALPELEATAAEKLADYEAAAAGDLIDVAVLTQDLQHAQLTNREIDKRTRRQSLELQLSGKKRESETLTRAIERREEEKIAALAKAKLPVEGLVFDENSATYKGIPLDQLGEAEQVRISTSIAMAANPELRVIRIMHGEALDDDSMAVIAKMAEENDFQIWVAKVDSSGKVGIFLEDGEIKAENEE